MKVTILVPPYEPGGAGATADSARQLATADELTEAIRGVLSVDVPIVHGPLAAAPTTGYVLAFRVASTVDPELVRRIIAFDEDRLNFMKRLELHAFAGAVEKQRYFEWYTHRGDDRGYGLVSVSALFDGMASALFDGARRGIPVRKPRCSTRRQLDELAATSSRPPT